jgi:uncharacterized short protein YbdD (DUF466 family)
MSVLSRIRAVLRAIIGAPDYERYLAHMRRAHPDLTPLSLQAFAAERMARRYDQPGGRCC